jgi:hypothetical protein
MGKQKVAFCTDGLEALFSDLFMAMTIYNDAEVVIGIM